MGKIREEEQIKGLKKATVFLFVKEVINATRWPGYLNSLFKI